MSFGAYGQLTDGTNIPWTISFEGPVFIGKEKSGTVDIPAGGQTQIKTGFILGIGPVTATINAGGNIRTASGIALGPLVLGLE